MTWWDAKHNAARILDTENPCIKCTDKRHTACHDTCIRHKVFNHKIAMLAKQIMGNSSLPPIRTAAMDYNTRYSAPVTPVKRHARTRLRWNPID